MNRLLPILFAFVYFSKSAYTQSKASATFKCDFEKDTCGLVNDDNRTAKWVRKMMDLGGRKGNVMLLETDGKGRQIGRLFTPVFDREWSGVEESKNLYVEGCLSLDLYSAGDGVIGFSGKQQDDSGVHSRLSTSYTTSPEWRTFILNDIAAAGDYVRFIFDACVNPNVGESVVAIDNISFTTEACED